MTALLRPKDYLSICYIQRLGWIDIKQVGKQLQTKNIKVGHSNINQLELPNGEYGKFGKGIS